MDEALAAELARMAAEDQRVRQPPPGAEHEFSWRVDPHTRMEGQRLDVANTDRLREIISEHGWPGRSLVGDEGAHRAWLIAQHADRQLDFQREALELLADAVRRGDAAQRDLAYLTDRVRITKAVSRSLGPRSPRSKMETACPGQLRTPQTSTPAELASVSHRSRSTAATGPARLAVPS